MCLLPHTYSNFPPISQTNAPFISCLPAAALESIAFRFRYSCRPPPLPLQKKNVSTSSAASSLARYSTHCNNSNCRQYSVFFERTAELEVGCEDEVFGLVYWVGRLVSCWDSSGHRPGGLSFSLGCSLRVWGTPLIALWHVGGASF